MRPTVRLGGLLVAFACGLLVAWSVRGLGGWRGRQERSTPAALSGSRPEAPAAAPRTHAAPGGSAASAPTGAGPLIESPPAGQEVLEGRVVMGGRPVEGAVVVAGGRAIQARSQGDGRFSIPGLAPGRYAVRAIWGEASSLRSDVVVPGSPAAPLVLELRPAAPLAGRVIDGAGRAVAGAEVTLSELPLPVLPRTVRCDDVGRFRLSAVPAGRYFLSGAADGFVREGRAVRQQATESAPQLLTLPRAGALAGLVVDEDQRPVAGARVALWRDDLPLVRSAEGAAAGMGLGPLVEPAGELGVVRAPIPYPPLDGPVLPAATGSSRNPGSVSPARGVIVTDGQGRFRAGGLPAGPVAVMVSHAAHVDGRATVDLVAGGEAQVRVVLRKAVMVRGRVRDAAGREVVGAELWIDGALAAISDRKGRFELRRLPGAFDVEVRARGRARSLQRIEPSSPPASPSRGPAGGAEVELTIGAADSHLRGVVVDARGLPVAGARVRIQGAAGAQVDAATGPDGSFSVEDAPAGPLTVQVSHGEHTKTQVAGVQPGDDVRVTLAAGGVVEGEVVEARGGVVPGVRISLVDAGGARQLGSVDRTGRFRIAGCGAGSATLRAEAPGYLPAQAALDLPAAERTGDIVLRDVRVTLAEAGAVGGSVRDGWGQAVAGATVEGGGAEARTDGAGRFTLAPVPTGRLEITITAPGGQRVSESTYVERGRPAELDVRLR